jgi:hypothetical protein
MTSAVTKKKTLPEEKKALPKEELTKMLTERILKAEVILYFNNF